MINKKTLADNRGAEVFVDVETYPNYYLACFDFADLGKIWFELHEGQWSISYPDFNHKGLLWLLKNYKIITFNGNHFDIWVLLYSVQNDVSPQDIYNYAQDIISGDVREYKKDRQYSGVYINHIDLIELVPLKPSLKLIGGRIHAPKIQDLPYHHTTRLTKAQKEQVLFYCWNDTHTTRLLREELTKPIELRSQMSLDYGIDMRSRSDAQVAEDVIGYELKYLHGVQPKKATREELDSVNFKYQVPDNIRFVSDRLNGVLDVCANCQFTLDHNDKIQMPEAIRKLDIRIGETEYTIGIGGLHSKEKRITHISDDEYVYLDRDVASYYPMIIINQGLYPKRLGPKFLVVYKSIVDKRLAAKAAGDKSTANSLKITINGSYGKFGSPYSILFAPELLIQTTLSGQLYLLMLIEMLESEGFSVVSANTDGLVTKVKKDRRDEFGQIVEQWERLTRFDTEETEYSKLCSRDVNNYIGITTGGDIKSKGCFGDSKLSKNPFGEIIYDAVREHLVSRIEPETTINACTDIRKFLFVRKVKGGALDQEGNEIGKVVRWYYAKNEWEPLKYVMSGNKVSQSDGARTFMDLTVDFPQDIDYNRYSWEARKILNTNFSAPTQMNFLDGLV